MIAQQSGQHKQEDAAIDELISALMGRPPHHLYDDVPGAHRQSERGGGVRRDEQLQQPVRGTLHLPLGG